MPNDRPLISRPVKLTFFAIAVTTIFIIVISSMLPQLIQRPTEEIPSVPSVFDKPQLLNIIASPKDFYNEFKSLDSAQFPDVDPCEYKDYIVKVLGNSKDQSVLKLFLNGRDVYVSNFLTNSPTGIFENASDGTLYYMTVSKCAEDNYYANLYAFETVTFDRASEGLVVFITGEGKKMGILFSDGLPVFEVDTSGGFNRASADKLKELKKGETFSYSIAPNANPMPMDYQDEGKVVTIDIYPTVFNFGSILIKAKL